MAYSAPVLFCLPGALPSSCLFVVFVCPLALVVFFSLVISPLPTLRREKSGAQRVAKIFSGVHSLVVDVESLARKKLRLLR